MYSRSYFTEEDKGIRLPENYDGTAFSDSEKLDTPRGIGENSADTAEVGAEASRHKNPWEESSAAPPPEPPRSDESESVFARLEKSPLLGGLFSGGKLLGLSSLKFPKIGTEEILIIATALFLLLSKDGDKECAVILLLLLLVN